MAQLYLGQSFGYEITNLVIVDNLLLLASVTPIAAFPPFDYGKIPHITLKVAESVQPRMSNNVLEGLANW